MFNHFIKRSIFVILTSALLASCLCACSSKKVDSASSSDKEDDDDKEDRSSKKDRKKKKNSKDKTKDKDKDKEKDTKTGPALRPEHDADLEEYEKYLLDIGFYHSKEEAESVDVISTVSIEQPENTQPEMWYWSVLTSLADNTSVRIEQGWGSDELDSEYSSADTFVATETLYTGILNEGESIAANLYLGWYGTIRVTVINDSYFGSMLMGEDNWEYKVDEDNFPLPKYIIGKDYDLAGLGTDYKDEETFRKFIDGKWLCIDPETDVYVGTVSFEDDRLRIEELGEGYEYTIRGVYDIDNTAGIPDVISLEIDDDNTANATSRYDDWYGVAYRPGGVYHVETYQLYGTQIMVLSHSDPPDTLSYLIKKMENGGYEPDDLPDIDKEVSGRIKLVRFRGVGDDSYFEPEPFNVDAYMALMGKEPGTWELKAVIDEDGNESEPDKPNYAYFSQCATMAIDGYSRFFLESNMTSNGVMFTGIDGSGSYGTEIRLEGNELYVTIGKRSNDNVQEEPEIWSGRFEYRKETDYDPDW